jgi:DNA-binding NarL/FixJ family response regulator
VNRVLVVEDDPEMRRFFAASVSQCKDLTLLASVGTVAEALAWIDVDAHAIDVLLADLGLPDGSGLEVIRHAVARNPRCEPLVISMFGDESNVLASIEAGALGYIHKDSTPEDIAQTILELRAGGSPISPLIARGLLAKYSRPETGKRESSVEHNGIEHKRKRFEDSAEPVQRNLLTPREGDVLALIARGFSYAEIARLEKLTVHTVQSHIKSIYTKLSVHSRSEAVFEATRMGLLSAHD